MLVLAKTQKTQNSKLNMGVSLLFGVYGKAGTEIDSVCGIGGCPEWHCRGCGYSRAQ